MNEPNHSASTRTCPTCGALPGKSCISGWGKFIPDHRLRSFEGQEAERANDRKLDRKYTYTRKRPRPESSPP